MSEAGAGEFVRRRRRSRAEAEQLVAEYEASGLTRQVFCAGRGLSVAALDKYRRQHSRVVAGGEGRLVPVEVLPGVEAMGSGIALWLELSKGGRIGVRSGFDAATFERLITILERV